MPQQRYVCGFLFDLDFQQVALIQKNRPPHQAGKYNGLGGKIELGEQPEDAMTREFYEESGLLVTHWKPFARIEGDGWVSYFVFANDERVLQVQSMEDQEVCCVKIEELPFLPLMPNLHWLIPLCKDENLFFATITYANPNIPHPCPPTTSPN